MSASNEGTRGDLWRPAQYGRFGDERERPLRDLIAMLRPHAGRTALDLGCGTGAGTALLHAHGPSRLTIGVDTSAAMLERAPRDVPRLHFVRGEVERLPFARSFDLVFSNAALHWIDDHETLLARLTERVTPGGQLAVQVPANHTHVSQLVAAEVARSEPFRGLLGGWTRVSPVLEPERYAEILHRLGWVDLDVRLIVYPHLLPGPDDVLEWVRGTTLTDYERRLSPDVYARFLDRYREVLLERLPAERPCLFTFRRVFFVGRRPAPGE